MSKIAFNKMAGLSIASACLIGCADGGTYTLYRNSVVDSAMRIHVATFDAGDGNDYNSENCEIAGQLFQKQQGVAVRYWCEKGNYRK